jgi:diguanylate cyclase (GGDEF)-like protein/PAS domain S-box-containing protein
VRWTVYLAFLVMAAALLLQAAVHVQGEQARSGEAALLDMAGLQRTFSQQMAWRAARLALAETQTQIQTQTQTDNDAFAADDRSEQAVALERLLNSSMQEALQFEALVARQLQTAGAAQAGLAAALDDWLVVRERLWYRGGALLHHVRAATTPGAAAPPVAAAAVAVQLEAERALQAAQLLSDRLRALAEHRGQRQRADLKLWAAGLLVLLGLLALAVVEPTVRRVRRQLGLLQAQALSLKQLALVAERTRAMVLITDAQGGTVWANQAFTDITGWPLAQALGQQPAALLGTAEAAGDDDVATTISTTATASAECSLRAALASGVGVRIDCRARARDGTALWLDCDLQPVHDDEGRLTGWVNVNHDVTVRRSLQDQLHASARTDALTRLPNRAAVMERLQRAIEHARRHPGYGFAVLFMDFDRFKQVNDTLGHTMGDELLRQIAARLETTLRPGDAVARVDSDLQLAARLGGDEFVVVLEGVHDASTVGAVADRLLADLAQPYTVGSQQLQSTASIGIVLWGHAGALADLRADADSVLRDADTAMYEAKRGGRNRYVIFDRSMQERVAHALTVEHELRRALEGDELFVVYQPVVDLASRRLTAVEALVRWRHPRRGLVPPVEFIGIAEECGLIDAVGDFVLRTACAQFAQWQRTLGDAAPPVLAVNLSRAQLRVAGLVPEVKWVLEQHGMQPQQLQLEVTESLAAQDEGVQHTLRELKVLGVSLALDDFGTGYSSLACLHQLPVDRVKVDRSFVMHAQTVEYHRVLIEATIRVARTLGMVTVAEGIETEGQAQLMHELQCDYGQGYLFARPLDAQALVAWVQQRQEQQQQQPQQQALAQAAG